MVLKRLKLHQITRICLWSGATFFLQTWMWITPSLEKWGGVTPSGNTLRQHQCGKQTRKGLSNCVRYSAKHL